jgi:hypothetical protein
MIEQRAGRMLAGPTITLGGEWVELGRTEGGVVFTPKRKLRQRIAFRHPAPGLDPARLIGARIDTLTLHGVNLAGPGLIVVSAEPVDDSENLWIVAERWEDA